MRYSCHASNVSARAIQATLADGTQGRRASRQTTAIAQRWQEIAQSVADDDPERAAQLAHVRSDAGHTMAHAAAHAGAVRVLAYIAAEQPGMLELTCKKGCTALHIAAAAGAASVFAMEAPGLRWMLGVADAHGMLPVHVAAQRPDADTLTRVVRAAGTSMLSASDQTRHGRGAVHHAALAGSVACVRAVEQLGSSLTVVDRDGMSAAHYAAAAGHVPVLRLFDEDGWPELLLSTDKRGRTIAHHAAQHGCDDVLRWIGHMPLPTHRSMLYDMPTSDMWHPCHSAAAADRGDSIITLHAQGGRTAETLRFPCTVTRNGVRVRKNVAQLAAETGGAGVLRALHATGDPELQRMLYEAEGDALPAVSAIVSSVGGRLFVLRALHSIGGSARASLARTRTGAYGSLAHIAAGLNDVPVLRLLREFGGRFAASLGRTDLVGITPLHEACMSGAASAARFLVETAQGSVAAADSAGSTPMHIAAERSDALLMSVLVRGAREEARAAAATRRNHWMRSADNENEIVLGEFGETPFEVAVLHAVIRGGPAALNCVRLLHEHGLVGEQQRHMQLHRALAAHRLEHVAVGLSMLPHSVVAALPLCVKRAVVASHALRANPVAAQLYIKRQDPVNGAWQLFATEPTVSRVAVKFIGEPSSGDGLRREWLSQVAAAAAPYFEPTANGDSLHPRHDLKAPHDLAVFRTVGAAVAVALSHGEAAPLALSQPCVAALIGSDGDCYPRLAADLRWLDEQLYASSVKWMTECDAEEWLQAGLELQFRDLDGAELCPGGARRDVTLDNRFLYAQEFALHRTYNRVAAQLGAMREGAAIMHSSVHAAVRNTLQPEELMQLVRGTSPTADMLFLHAAFRGYTKDSAQVSWLRAWLAAGDGRVGWLLRFVTGCSNLPVGGLAVMAGHNNHPQPFTIAAVATADTDQIMPLASTCFNTLLLPAYSSAEQLALMLGRAVDMAGDTSAFDEHAVAPFLVPAVDVPPPPPLPQAVQD